MPSSSTTTTPSSLTTAGAEAHYNALMQQMSSAQSQWQEEEGPPVDDHDHLLQQALDLALQQGKGWGPGEKEAYLQTILDDDYIPPLFASNTQEVADSGLQEAFTSLIYDGESPTSLMLSFKQKAAAAFANGQRNTTGNLQYYRDAINFYQEALAWALQIQPLQPGDYAVADTPEPTYTADELAVEHSKLASNLALMHWKLSNWGHCREEAQKALQYDKTNLKAWYRLALAHEKLQQWEAAGDALDEGLQCDPQHQDLLKVQRRLGGKIQKARLQRQQRERARAQRVAKVKQVWKYTREQGIRLGRTSLVNSASEDDDNPDEEESSPREVSSHWHQHLPHSGALPARQATGSWDWPCLFLYPSHQQSDFITNFAESEMMAERLAQIFPELEDEGPGNTSMPWDYNNEFVCSQLALYVELHPTITTTDNAKKKSTALLHPDHQLEPLTTQAATMRFYEACRALKGDEGPEMAQVVRALEGQHWHRQRQAWKKAHGSLWHVPPPPPLLRIHPAVTLGQLVRETRVVIPNFIVTILVVPENHPAHPALVKEHSCVGVLEPAPISS